MKKVCFYIAVLAISALPVLTYAGPIVRSGESVSIDASQVLKGDFYGLGGVVTMSGSAEDDAHLLGGTVTVNASTGGDLSILGGSVQVHGTVGDDLRVVGGDVTLAETVKGDVVVIGGMLSVLSTATIEGDIIFIGGELTVEGEVYGTVHGTADRVRINAKIGGDASLIAGTLVTLGDNAEVLGNVTYESRNDIVRAQNARVGGTVRKVDTAPEVHTNVFQTYVFFVLVLTFAALFLYFVGRSKLQILVDRSPNTLGMSGFVGLAVFLVVPFVSGVLLVSVIGSLLGMLLMVSYVCLVILAFIVSGPVVGYQIQRALTKKTTVSLSTVFFGTALFGLLGLVPYVGGFTMLACFVVTLGVISMALYRGIRS